MKALTIAMALLAAGCTTLGSYKLLGDAELARVHQGMTRDEARQVLGAPHTTMEFPNTQTVSWDYRVQDAWGYLTLFSVIFGPQGTVVGTVSARLNDGGDHGK